MRGKGGERGKLQTPACGQCPGADGGAEARWGQEPGRGWAVTVGAKSQAALSLRLGILGRQLYSGSLQRQTGYPTQESGKDQVPAEPGTPQTRTCERRTWPDCQAQPGSGDTGSSNTTSAVLPPTTGRPHPSSPSPAGPRQHGASEHSPVWEEGHRHGARGGASLACDCQSQWLLKFNHMLLS